jgi:hypothetical protein
MSNPIDIHMDMSVEDALEKLIRINSLWEQRATVKKPEMDFDVMYDLNLPDFPLALIPFHGHPDFLKQPEDKRIKLNAWAWLGYNKNTNDGEELVANPAFLLMSKGFFPGTEHEEVVDASLQAMIDENYHTLLHTQSSMVTKRKRNLTENIKLPNSYSSRQLVKMQSLYPEQWKKDLLTVLFATVSEVSINAHLDLIADSNDIQPMNKAIAIIHNKDEHAHAAVCVQIAKLMYSAMTPSQKDFFLEALPFALETYVSGDCKTFEAILKGLGFDHIDTLLNDSFQPGKRIIRDYSGLKRLCDELEITDKINFDFGIH